MSRNRRSGGLLGDLRGGLQEFRGATNAGRGIISSVRRGARDGRAIFGQDPLREEADQARFEGRIQRGRLSAEEDALRRQVLRNRAIQEGVAPYTDRDYGGFEDPRSLGQRGVFEQPMDGDVRMDRSGRVMEYRQPDAINRMGIDFFGIGERGGWRRVDPAQLTPEQVQQLEASQNQGRFGVQRSPLDRQNFRVDQIDGTYRPGRETNPALDREIRRGREPLRHERITFGEENVLEAFGRLSAQQQQSVVGALQQSGALRGDPRDPQALAAGLTAGLRQNFPNINPATTNPSDLVNPLVDMPGQIAARARDQQGRGGRAAPAGAATPPRGEAAGRPAAPPAPRMERGEHVAEFQRRAISMNPENAQHLIQGLPAGSRPDDGIAGNNTEAVRREVINRLNADRGNNPEVPANTNLRDLNRIMEQRGIRVGQGPAPEGAAPARQAAERIPEQEALDPLAAVAALEQGMQQRQDFNRFRDEARAVIDQAAADRGPIARAPMISDPEGLASLEEARATLAQAGAGDLVDPDGQTRPSNSPIRIGGNEIAPNMGA